MESCFCELPLNKYGARWPNVCAPGYFTFSCSVMSKESVNMIRKKRLSKSKEI